MNTILAVTQNVSNFKGAGIFKNIDFKEKEEKLSYKLL